MIKNEVYYLIILFLSLTCNLCRINSKSNLKNIISLINQENLDKRNELDEISLGNSQSESSKQKLHEKMMDFNFLSNFKDSDFSNKIKDYNRKLSIYGGIEDRTENGSENEEKDNNENLSEDNEEDDDNEISFNQINDRQIKKTSIELLKESVKVLIEQVISLEEKLNKVGNTFIINQIIDMPSKGKESKTKHGLNFDDIQNISVSIINGSKNNKIIRSQNNLDDEKVLFNWYVDKDYFYLLYPSHNDKKNDLFLNGAKVNVSYIIKNK